MKVMVRLGQTSCARETPAASTNASAHAIPKSRRIDTLLPVRISQASSLPRLEPVDLQRLAGGPDGRCANGRR
jgi:hypothetical protein